MFFEGGPERAVRGVRSDGGRSNGQFDPRVNPSPLRLESFEGLFKTNSTFGSKEGVCVCGWGLQRDHLWFEGVQNQTPLV